MSAQCICGHSRLEHKLNEECNRLTCIEIGCKCFDYQTINIINTGTHELRFGAYYYPPPRFTATFAFKPLDYVTVTFLDLKYKGRVQSCRIADASAKMYQVQYGNDTGDLKMQDFFEDELKLIE